jgi:hypothetical protein
LVTAVLAENINGNGGGGGRLSPASLDLDTCGCPTEFGDPTCESRTSWTLEKSSDTGDLNDPNVEAYSFTVTVTEGPTKDILTGEGRIVVTNSGQQTPFLASVAVLLEDLHEGAGQGDAPGPSGRNWDVLASAAEAESADCGNVAVTCDGDWGNSPGSKLVLYTCGGDPNNENDIIALSDRVEIPPAQDNDGDGRQGEDPDSGTLADDQNCWGIVDNDRDGLIDEDPDFGIDDDGDGLIDEDGPDGIDNDGDGAVDEDPASGIDDDGDGLIDEDGPDDDGDGLIDEDSDCEDAVEICFIYEFDITGLGNSDTGDGTVPSEDDLRIDLLVTFDAIGGRGGTCRADTTCDGTDEVDVRTVQQRLRFDPPGCTPACDCVDLTDDGATAGDGSCVDVTTNSLNEEICTQGEGTQTVRNITGTVDCVGQGCDTRVSNTATLEGDTCNAEDIAGSPASDSFGVTCPEGACCFSDGTCAVLSPDGCAEADGTYQGDGTTCDDVDCGGGGGDPGGCCLENGDCVDVETPQDCDGVYQGGGNFCDGPPPIECPDDPTGDFCSQTQGGWGSEAAGNNTGALRDANFDAIFPDGLCVGDNWDSFFDNASCTDGAGGGHSLYLSSSQAVEDLLPTGGTAAALTADQTDPLVTSAGVFAGQLVAATLNVAFDLAGVGKSTPQRTPPPYLGDLVYGDCVAAELQGLSVNDVIELANIAISGGGTPAGVSISDLNDALSSLNEEFVDCEIVATGCLTAP